MDGEVVGHAEGLAELGEEGGVGVLGAFGVPD